MAPSIDPRAVGKLPLHDLPTPEPESPLRPRKPYRFSTLCATVENPEMKDQYGSSSVPIYQSATFKGVGNEYDYSRSGNPTRSHLRMFSSFSSVIRSVLISRSFGRTPHRQNFFCRSCIHRLIGNGSSGRHPAAAEARRRGYCWRRPLRRYQPPAYLHPNPRWCDHPPCRYNRPRLPLPPYPS